MTLKSSAVVGYTEESINNVGVYTPLIVQEKTRVCLDFTYRRNIAFAPPPTLFRPKVCRP